MRIIIQNTSQWWENDVQIVQTLGPDCEKARSPPNHRVGSGPKGQPLMSPPSGGVKPVGGRSLAN